MMGLLRLLNKKPYCWLEGFQGKYFSVLSQAKLHSEAHLEPSGVSTTRLFGENN